MSTQSSVGTCRAPESGDAVMSVLNPEREQLKRWAGMDRRFVRGDGVWLEDDRGRRFLDAYAQYGALALGHNHPAVKATVTRALEAGMPAMVQPYSAPPAAALAHELYRIADGRFSRCVFTTSGAETVEAAIKLVRMRTGRPLIVSANGSYHGKTMGALAASDRLEFAAQHHHPASGFARVAFGDIEALDAFLRKHGRLTAGFIVEPVQGERGVFEPPTGYLRDARQRCEDHGVAFIADEIQTGLFRTGSLFACDQDGVSPDVLLLAKPLGGGLFPLGACLVTERFWDAGFALGHSSTFANNNVACAVGLAVLREMQKPDFQRNLADVSVRLGRGLRDLARRYPRSIAEVRGRGLLHAIELRKPGAACGCFLTYLHQQGLSAYLLASVLAQDHGVLVLPALDEGNVVRITPPLIAAADDISRLLDGLGHTLALWESWSSRRIASTVLAAVADQRRGQDAPATALQLPARRRAAEPRIDYAFVVHPTTVGDIVCNDPTFAHFAPHELRAYQAHAAQLPPGVVAEIPAIESPAGACVRGVLIGLPMLPEQMLACGRTSVREAIAGAVALAHARGARLVGLGAFSSIYSRRGVDVAGRGPWITTGNLLTAGMAFAALLRALERQGTSLANSRVGIVGARGSVGALVAQLVARARPREMILVGNPASGTDALDRIARRLRALGCATLTTTRDMAPLTHCNAIVTASSSARPVLGDVRVAPGTIVCDVARPFDTSAAMRRREDIVVIDGGLVALPGAPRSIGAGNVQGQPPGVALACLSETILLALAGAERDHGVGEDLDVSEVDAMLALAMRHGFALAEDAPASQLRMVCA